MYAEDKHKSASYRWNKAKPQDRVKMLRTAGYNGLSHAYQAVDQLPLMMKLDLNFVVERENRNTEALATGAESGALHA